MPRHPWWFKRSLVPFEEDSHELWGGILTGRSPWSSRLTSVLASTEIVLKLSVAWNVDATGKSGYRWEIHPIIFFRNLAFFSSTSDFDAKSPDFPQQIDNNAICCCLNVITCPRRHHVFPRKHSWGYLSEGPTLAWSLNGAKWPRSICSIRNRCCWSFREKNILYYSFLRVMWNTSGFRWRNGTSNWW